MSPCLPCLFLPVYREKLNHSLKEDATLWIICLDMGKEILDNYISIFPA